jgi:hypothetical protein
MNIPRKIKTLQKICRMEIFANPDIKTQDDLWEDAFWNSIGQDYGRNQYQLHGHAWRTRKRHHERHIIAAHIIFKATICPFITLSKTPWKQGHRLHGVSAFLAQYGYRGEDNARTKIVRAFWDLYGQQVLDYENGGVLNNWKRNTVYIGEWYCLDCVYHTLKMIEGSLPSVLCQNCCVHPEKKKT